MISTMGMIQFNSVVCSGVLPDVPEVHRVRDIRVLVRLPAEQDPLPAPALLLDLEVCEMFVLVQTGGPQQVSLLDPPHPAVLAQPGDAARPPTGPAGLGVLPATGTSHDWTQSVSQSVRSVLSLHRQELYGDRRVYDLINSRPGGRGHSSPSQGCRPASGEHLEVLYGGGILEIVLLLST